MTRPKKLNMFGVHRSLDPMAFESMGITVGLNELAKRNIGEITIATTGSLACTLVNRGEIGRIFDGSSNYEQKEVTAAQKKAMDSVRAQVAPSLRIDSGDLIPVISPDFGNRLVLDVREDTTPSVELQNNRTKYYRAIWKMAGLPKPKKVEVPDDQDPKHITIGLPHFPGGQTQAERDGFIDHIVGQTQEYMDQYFPDNVVLGTPDTYDDDSSGF